MDKNRNIMVVDDNPDIVTIVMFLFLSMISPPARGPGPRLFEVRTRRETALREASRGGGLIGGNPVRARPSGGQKTLQGSVQRLRVCSSP